MQLVKGLEWKVKVGFGAIGFLALIGAAESVGVPTKEIGQAIAQAVYSAALHNVPAP